MSIKKLNENLIEQYRSLTIVRPDLADNKNWQIGTLKADPSNAGLSYKKDTNGNYSLFDARKTLIPGTVVGGHVNPNQLNAAEGEKVPSIIEEYTIRNVNMHDNSINNRCIMDRTINHIKMQYHTLTEDEMADFCIINRLLAPECVTDDKIKQHTILNRSLNDGCVELRNMHTDSVGTSQIINHNVNNDKITFNTITNDKLKDKTIEYDKIKPYTILGSQETIISIDGVNTKVQGNIAPKTINHYNIADKGLININYADGSVDNRVIGTAEVYGDAIKPLGIQTNHIDNRAIISEKIGVGEVKNDNIDLKAVSRGNLDNNLGYIADNAIAYDSNYNVSMHKQGTCNVTIGTGSIIEGTRISNKNGSLNVYGDIQADRVYNMAYADLAEAYVPGEELEPGDAAFIREDGKVYKLGLYCVGVVSDEYAMCFGATDEEIKNKEKVAVALIGKVHVNTFGSTAIGRKVYSPYSNGGKCVGIALENTDEEGKHKVLTLVRPS